MGKVSPIIRAREYSHTCDTGDPPVTIYGIVAPPSIAGEPSRIIWNWVDEARVCPSCGDKLPQTEAEVSKEESK